MAWLDERKSGIYLRDRNPPHCEPLGKISLREAKSIRRNFEKAKEEGRTIEGELGVLTTEVYDRYIAFLERNNYSPKTIRSIKQGVFPFVNSVHRVKELSPDAVKAWKVHLESHEYKKGKRYALDTIAHRLRHIKAFCSWMVNEEKIISRSPFEVTIPEGRKDAGRALQGNQVHALFEHWPAERSSGGNAGKQSLSKLFFQIVYFGGTRLTETLGDENMPEIYPGAQYENVDRTRSIVKLEKTKGGDSREVALPRFLIKIIPKGEGPIFRGQISERTLRDHLAQAAGAAGITGRLRIHDGRVSSATEWARKNRDPRGAMDQFGWKTEKMAMHYTKVATEERISQAQRITYK